MESSAGPSPIGINGSSFTGAIQSVVGQKITTNPDMYVLFAGAVNGGVWRLEGLSGSVLQPAPQPPAVQWLPVADSAPTLAISSVALDPNDSSGNTVWLGTGQFSSGSRGGPMAPGPVICCLPLPGAAARGSSTTPR